MSAWEGQVQLLMWRSISEAESCPTRVVNSEGGRIRMPLHTPNRWIRPWDRCCSQSEGFRLSRIPCGLCKLKAVSTRREVCSDWEGMLGHCVGYFIHTFVVANSLLSMITSHYHGCREWRQLMVVWLDGLLKCNNTVFPSNIVLEMQQ